MAEPLVRSVSPVFNEDNSVDWWELSDQWRIIRHDPPGVVATETGLATAIAALSVVYASINHSHKELGDINFTGEVSVNGDPSVKYQEVVIPKVGTLVFVQGILLKFAPE
jgi:hypothetical protein